MGKNRIEELFRDPTLEHPAADHFVVRHRWGSFCVTEETAIRILAAVSGAGSAGLLRIETITGSMIFLRADAIVYVRQSTRAQRRAEQRFWKMLDDEEDEDEEDWK